MGPRRVSQFPGHLRLSGWDTPALFPGSNTHTHTHCPHGAHTHTSLHCFLVHTHTPEPVRGSHKVLSSPKCLHLNMIIANKQYGKEAIHLLPIQGWIQSPTFKAFPSPTFNTFKFKTYSNLKTLRVALTYTHYHAGNRRLAGSSYRAQGLSSVLCDHLEERGRGAAGKRIKRQSMHTRVYTHTCGTAETKATV